MRQPKTPARAVKSVGMAHEAYSLARANAESHGMTIRDAIRVIVGVPFMRICNISVFEEDDWDTPLTVEQG